MAGNSSNKSLHKANVAKKDEFYTQLSDIENELKHFKDHFKGKTVFCNCDDPKESNFVKYFSMNFEHLGLKKLIATHYKEANLFTNEPAYKLEYSGDKDGNRMPDPSEFMTKMISDGDFRSKESVELLKEADIVVTNPPFSLFREYVDQLIKYDKKFLVIGSKNAITYKDIFKLIKDNKIWLGPSFSGGNAYFQTPYDNGEYASGVYNPETGLVKFRNVGWFTNLDYKERHEELILYKKYSPEFYPKYDNYDAIEVSKVSEIPIDYYDIMGVPVTFLDRYNPDQFEIVGNEYDLQIVKGRGYINGKRMYGRIFIKKRK